MLDRTRHFLLVVHCDYITILYCFKDITICVAHLTTRDLQ